MVRGPKPHIIEPLRPLIIKKHRAIMIMGTTHQIENVHSCEPYMNFTSLKILWIFKTLAWMNLFLLLTHTCLTFSFFHFIRSDVMEMKKDTQEVFFSEVTLQKAYKE
jgi:hypothetical protein